MACIGFVGFIWLRGGGLITGYASAHEKLAIAAVQLRELVKKLIPESIGKEIQKQTQGIFPLKDVLIRKVKILKKPRFDITNLKKPKFDIFLCIYKYIYIYIYVYLYVYISSI